MYKSKLQELCQQRKWRLPEYNVARLVDHNPNFSANVTINGQAFGTAQPFRSSKEAQNDAAKVAFEHFCYPKPKPANPIPSVSSFPQPSLPGSSDLQHLYKNQLQIYAQKRNLHLPTYSCEREGPPHNCRFKCRVTIDGHTYEGQEFLRSMKEAENAVAKAALMSLLPNGVQEDDSGLYKNLLQELIQKEGFSVPTYITKLCGEPHMTIFVSTVNIEGEPFTGQEARSKKQAETSAAKVAYHTLREPPSSCKNSKSKAAFGSSANNKNLSKLAGLKVNKDIGKCFFCHKLGHLRKDCEGFKGWLAKKGLHQDQAPK